MELAARDGRLIINADALQVYAQWNLLSARPSLADEAGLPHALYGHIGRDTPYSVGHWLREVAPLLNRPVVIVGGSGLNFAALTMGLADIPQIPGDVRAAANALLAARGTAPLLAALDPETRAQIDTQNPARVQRAYEVQIATGRGMADWHRATPAPLMARTGCTALVMRPDVPWLDARITQRFDAMITSGALSEAAAALPHWDARAPWAQAIGAPELIAHLRGEMTLPAARDAAILASRQYAKRQRTWFRARMRDWHSITLP
jgi:tRNA dimethylallyltransferase